MYSHGLQGKWFEKAAKIHRRTNCLAGKRTKRNNKQENGEEEEEEEEEVLVGKGRRKQG